MTDARRGLFWHRAAPVAAIGALLIGATAQGCGGGDSDTGGGGAGGKGGGGSPSTTSTNMGGNNGGGGSSTTGTAGSPPTGPLTATVVTSNADAFNNPFDATPDPKGTTVYFTGLDILGDAAVFKVSASGGTVTTIAKGDPLVAPFGIATSSVGDKLYVADPGAESPTGTDRGVIWELATTAGAKPNALTGTNGVAVRGLVLNVEGTKDILYFTGLSAAGVPEVLKSTAAGSTASVVVSGDPLVDPSGIAIASDGDIYVADTIGSSSHQAQIIRIHNGTASVFVSDLVVNYPAGIALSTDDKTLLVSALNPASGTDQIVQIDTTSKKETPFTKSGSVDLTKLIEAAGMHRSVKGDVYAWVDTVAGAKSSGTIYLLKF